LENTKNNNHKHLHSFHPRVINKTNINFSTNELNLLNKGLKYNLPYKQKNWISTLAIEAETAITQLPSHHQEYFRAITAHRIKQPYKQQTNSGHSIQEYQAIKQIKRKLEQQQCHHLKS